MSRWTTGAVMAGAAAAMEGEAAASADWKKDEREAAAGDGGVCDGNNGDGTGGRITLMPTRLMKTVGKGLTP